MDSTKEEKNETHWDKVFYLWVHVHFFTPKQLKIIIDGDDRSDLLVKVYQKHHFGKDKEVGRITDTIGGVLGRLEDHNMIPPKCSECYFDSSSGVKSV